MAIVYLITNTINGKEYVGFTSEDSPVQRWRCHRSRAKIGSQCAIHCAIRKYGEHAFSLEVVAEGSCESMLREEQSQIVARNTLAPRGYNLTSGGEFVELSMQTRQKMSVSAKVRVPRPKTAPDSMRRRRAASQRFRGEQNPHARLTETSVHEIRRLRHQGQTFNAIAEQFGVSENTARNAALRITWAHVD